MRRTIFLASLAVVLVGLTACGGDAQQQASSTPSSTPSAVDTSPSPPPSAEVTPTVLAGGKDAVCAAVTKTRNDMVAPTSSAFGVLDESSSTKDEVTTVTDNMVAWFTKVGPELRTAAASSTDADVKAALVGWADAMDEAVKDISAAAADRTKVRDIIFGKGMEDSDLIATEQIVINVCRK